MLRAEMAPSVDLRPYLPSPTSRPRVFSRRDLKRPAVSLSSYAQIVQRDGIVEGSFAGSDEAAEAGGRTRSVAPPRDGTVFAITLNPPMPRLPATIGTDAPTRLRSDVRVCDDKDRERFRGTIDRVVTWEGIESVTLEGSLSVECARLRCVTRIRLFLGPWIELTEYLWLARDLGEVRRIERLRGWAWFWPFDEVRQYDLIRPVPPVRRTNPCAAAVPPPWARLRIHFDRLLPSPQLGGIVVEYAMTEATTAEPPARAEPPPGPGRD